MKNKKYNTEIEVWVKVWEEEGIQKWGKMLPIFKTPLKMWKISRSIISLLEIYVYAI